MIYLVKYQINVDPSKIQDIATNDIKILEELFAQYSDVVSN